MRTILFCISLCMMISLIYAADIDFINISGNNMELDENGTQIIKGDVRLIYENTILTAEKAKYNNTDSILEAFDNVKVQDEKYNLICNYMITYVNKNHTIAKQNPYIIEKYDPQSKAKDRMILKADVIEVFTDENRVLAKGNVLLSKELLPQYKDITADYSPSTMRSDSLEMFMNDDRSIARGNVKIKNKNFQAFSDQAMYYTAQQKLILTGNAHAFQKTEQRENKVFGQKIVYFFDTERVIIVKARADVYPNKSSEKGKE